MALSLASAATALSSRTSPPLPLFHPRQLDMLGMFMAEDVLIGWSPGLISFLLFIEGEELSRIRL